MGSGQNILLIANRFVVMNAANVKLHFSYVEAQTNLIYFFMGENLYVVFYHWQILKKIDM